MSEWKEYKLGELIESISKTYNFTTEEVCFLNTSDILDGKFLHQNFTPPNQLPGQAKKTIQKGDLLYSEIRPANKRYALVDFDATKYVVSTKLMVLRSKGQIEHNYLKYFLTAKEMLDYLQMIAEDRSGTFPQITFDIISSLEILLPPFTEQQAIAEVLSSIDDKIDLLNRQNQTLEQMAETLFRKWFIDLEFDSTIADLIYIQNGYAFKSKDFSDSGNNKVIKIKNISNNIVDISNCDCVSDDIAKTISDKFKIVSGDILFAMTGAEIGKMGIVENNGKSLWLNQRVGLFKEKFEGAKYLAYLCLLSDFGQDYILNTATGSAQPNISSSGIEQCPFPKLSLQEIQSKGIILVDIFRKVNYNLGQVKSLQTLRDTLLPKLMNGQARVKIG